MRSRLREALFWAAFCLLALLTAGLLAASVLFFTSAPVRAQLGAWLSIPGSGLEPTTAEPPPAVMLPPRERKARFEMAQRRSGSERFYLPYASGTADSMDILPSELPEAEVFERLGDASDEVVKEPAFADGVLVIPALGIEEVPATVPVVDGSWYLVGLGHRVGWLETTGSLPGGRKAMVFVGHVTLAVGGGGPFYSLQNLAPGDTILYRTEDTVYEYRVGERTVVPPEDVQHLYDPDGRKLILVTCSTWDMFSQSYAERLLVEAELVGKEKLVSNK